MKSFALVLVLALGIQAIPVAKDSSEKKDFGEFVSRVFKELKADLKCGKEGSEEDIGYDQDKPLSLDAPNWK